MQRKAILSRLAMCVRPPLDDAYSNVDTRCRFNALTHISRGSVRILREQISVCKDETEIQFSMFGKQVSKIHY